MRLANFFATALLAGSLGLLAAPAQAEETTCVRGVPAQDVASAEVDAKADAQSDVLVLLRLSQIHKLATGKGTGIAVVDSGIVRTKRLRVAEGKSFVSGKVLDGHGTIVGGLIGGGGAITGMAPGARLYDVQVANGEPGEGSTSPTRVKPAHVAAAIRWAVQNRDKVDVINLSIGFEKPDPAIRTAIKAADKAGIVVVAAAGTRAPHPVTPPTDAGNAVGEDVASNPEPPADEVLFPATLPEVLAVTSRDSEMSMTADAVLAGPEIDVSAAVVGLRSVMLRGLVCTVGTPASSWAAASVSGLAALILERHPDYTPAQVRTLIEVTAQGGFLDSAMDGHGMIQPYEALTREVSMDAEGRLSGIRAADQSGYVAAQPQPPEDRHPERRRPLLWWGMGAGGLLLLSLVLRPLTAGRRR